jgi:DNA-binding NarL/FixJ family response regulator
MRASLPAIPLVGRDAETSEIRELLEAARAGRGGARFLVGDSGTGKSRLMTYAVEQAARRGFAVGHGRAFEVETGIPYAPISDALLPLLRTMEPASVSVLTRGAEAELAAVLPALSRTAAVSPPDESPEQRARLLWTFGQFLGSLAARQPLLLIVEDVQWADASSIELLHYVGRQLGKLPVAALFSYNESERDRDSALRPAEQSLASLGVASSIRLKPLTEGETGELVRGMFGLDDATAHGFDALLYEVTRGNPLFVEQTLHSLVADGRLRCEDGRWVGWEMTSIDVPASVREIVEERLDRLGPDARSLAEIHAVIGTRADLDTLAALTEGGEPAVVAALEELCRARVVLESAEGAGRIVYDFAHPVLREALYSRLGLARARLLHGAVAEALERARGETAIEQPDELAFHFSRAGARGGEKAAVYLAAAGRRALARHAYREAASYLEAALERWTVAAHDRFGDLLAPLARARQRVGDYAGAIELWSRRRDAAARDGDSEAYADAELRIGLARRWSGSPDAALPHFAAGLERAAAESDGLRTRLHLGSGETLAELGRPDEAILHLRTAMDLAERAKDHRLQSRVHRALLLHHTWTGPPAAAREHGNRALELSARTGDHALAATAHWALAAMEGLTGHLDAMAGHVRECGAIAERIRSPLHQTWVAEVALEHLAATGRWDAAVAVGERGIAQARTFRQPTLLPRLLVWTAILHLSRGDHDRGRRYVEEAWRVSGAGRAEVGEGPLDIHTVVPAHTGMAALHLATGDLDSSIRYGMAGIAIADASGYIVWAIHRLLPIVGEACLLRRDLDGAREVSARLRDGSARMEHAAGIAWADTCDALLVHLGGELARSAAMLREVAERLDAVGLVPDAARARRQYAARLRDLGERDEALRQLRAIHETFLRMGAVAELQATREQIRELGVRPPAREASGSGAAGLTPREVEIVRLVANRRSNKAIGHALDISARTVSTHLSNIFRKLEIGSRGELAEVARNLDLTA